MFIKQELSDRDNHTFREVNMNLTWLLDTLPNMLKGKKVDITTLKSALAAYTRVEILGQTEMDSQTVVTREQVMEGLRTQIKQFKNLLQIARETGGPLAVVVNERINALGGMQEIEKRLNVLVTRAQNLPRLKKKQARSQAHWTQKPYID